jgi:hypothetical protein
MGASAERGAGDCREAGYAGVRAGGARAVSLPALFLNGGSFTDRYGYRFVSEARGECGYFSEETIPTAGEGCKSNALMRCCKDLGIASELWDPRYIREFKKTHAHEVWVEHVVNKKRRQVWKLKDADVAYPYKEVKSTPARA